MRYTPGMIELLMNLADAERVQRHFGISRARFYQWRALPGFPDALPTPNAPTCRLYDLRAIDEWRQEDRTKQQAV